MAKKKNKGFSLIEVIIAIAIMALLLTPIIKQLAQTMQLNRRAKVQQYATENAEFVLEYFKASSMKDLEKPETAELGKVNFQTRPNIDCKVYCLDPATNQLKEDVNIKYTIYEYELEPKELGSEKIEYNRRVIMDDLEKSIGALNDESGSTAYVYELVDGQNDTVEKLEEDGFEVDADGKVVKYNPQGYIEAIACKKVPGTASKNPNQANLGNMFDIDVNNMAVINGETVEYDAIAAEDFYSETMKRLKNSSVATDQQIYIDELEADVPGTVLTPDLYLTGMNKLTKVTVTDTGTAYKFVFEVIYENVMTAGSADGSDIIRKKYTIKTLTYDYDTTPGKEQPKCPDIYFEYQPFAVRDGNEILYAPKSGAEVSAEYILFDSEIENVKMYLLKPKWDRATGFINSGVTLFEPSLTGVPIYSGAAEGILASDTYYATSFIDEDSMLSHGGTYTIIDGVQHFNKLDNEIVRLCLVNKEDSSQMKVYTNLNIDEDGLKKDMSYNSQFKTNEMAIFNEKDAEGNYKNFLDDDGYKLKVESFDDASLQGLSKDISTAEKLYSIRVELRPVDDVYNSVVLLGAKGVN